MFKLLPFKVKFIFAALRLALGSFYFDELNLDASQVIPLLATAILLQMDPIIDQCTSIMIETINIQVLPC